MTYRTLLILAAMLVVGTAVAQPPRHAGGPDIEQLATLLDLDAYQAQEVERIMTEHREAIEAKREEMRASGERPDRETMEAAREQMRSSLRTELATILTAEQLEKLDTLHEMRGDRHPRRHKRGDFDDSEKETS